MNMIIVGIEKTTFIDFPGKIACTLFVMGCNFRCGFCHNPELVTEKNRKEISQNEILDFLGKRKKQLEGVCITGGEPLININPEFLKKIKELGYFIKIDTNGSFPEKLKEIIDKKLVDFIAMDIKSSKENYNNITNSEINLKDIEKSIKLISNSGVGYEFRTTIIENIHNNEEIKKIGIWLNEICDKKPEKFALQGFKNNGKFIDMKFKTIMNTSSKRLEELKNIAEDYFKKVEIRE